MGFMDIHCSLAIEEKLWTKHHVELREVEEAITGEAYVRRGREGLYEVLGRTAGGRYLFAVVRDLGGGVGLLVTAREMETSERRLYSRR